MLSIVLIVFACLIVFYYQKGELQYVRDNLEIQLRQARFRIDRLEGRVRELEERLLDSAKNEAALKAVPTLGPD